MGAFVGGVIGLICCFFSYGFAVIVDAAQKYLDLNTKDESKKKKKDFIPETPEEIDAWIKKGESDN